MKIRKIVIITIALITAGMLNARAQRFNRGIEMSKQPFIPKGQWIAGGTVSYSEHNNDDYDFLVISGIKSDGYNFSVSPVLGYCFKNNLVAGGRFSYGRSLLKINSAALDLGDDIDLSVDDYYRLQHSYTGMGIFRYYVPLGNSQRFALVSEIQLGFGGSQAKYSKGTGEAFTGTYETSYDISLGVAPGLVAFVTNVMAIEVNVGVLGLKYGHIKQVTDQVHTGTRRNSSMNFKVNLLSISLGTAFYL